MFKILIIHGIVYNFETVINTRQESCGEVMFLLVSVFHSVQVATEARTVGKRPVRILLECFLVWNLYQFLKFWSA